MNQNTNITIKKYCLLLSLIIVFLALLVFMALFVQKNYETKMQNITQKVLSSKYPEFIIKDKMKINTPITYSSFFYNLQSDNSSLTKNYAIIMRVTGLSGPQPVVFACIDGKTEYIGIAGIETTTEYRILDYGITDSMIKYYANFITEIIMKETI